MILLDCPDLPAVVNQNPSAGAAIAAADFGPERDGPLATIQPFTPFGAAQDEAIVVPVPPMSEDTPPQISVTLPDGVEEVADTIEVGGRVYDRDIEGTQAAGTFTFNPVTGVVVIYSPPPSPLLSVSYTAVRSGGLRTDLLKLSAPSIFRTWNIDGVFRLSRELEGQPSASFEFWAALSKRGAIESYFLSNPSRVYRFFGAGLVCSGLNIDEYRYRIRVSVSFGGREATLEKPVSLGAGGSRKRTSTTLSQVARSARGVYRGPRVRIPIDEEAPASTSTTMGEHESRSRVLGCFAFYSDPTATLWLKRWGMTRRWSLPDSAVVADGDKLCSYATVNGDQLPRYRNAEARFGEEGDPGEDAEELPRNEDFTLITGDPEPHKPPPEILSLVSPSIVYPDGPTRTQVITTYTNNTARIITKLTYGFIFSSLTVYYPFEQDFRFSSDGGLTRFRLAKWRYAPPALPVAYWKLCRSITTEKIYDPDTGYYLGESTYGWNRTRFKAEASAAEIINLLFDYCDNYNDVEQAMRLANKLRLYLWFDDSWLTRPHPQTLITPQLGNLTLPQNEFRRDKLEFFSTYYPDMRPTPPVPGEEEPEEPANNEVDPGPPVFPIETVVGKDSYGTVPDPDSTEDKELPDLQTGQRYNESRRVNIVFPRKGMSEREWRKKRNQERYETEEVKTNNEGANLEKSLAISSRTIHPNRPNESDRLTLYEDGPEPPASKPEEDTRIRYLVSSAEIDTASFGTRAVSSGEGGRQISFSSSSEVREPISGSVSFPGADTPERLKLAAETDLSIQTTNAAQTLSIRCKPEIMPDEGDLVTRRGVTYVVSAIDIEIRIAEGHLRADAWDLTLNRFLKPRVNLKRVNVE